MSIPQTGGGLIEHRDDLVRYLESGCKPASQFRIGTEHEKFGFDLGDRLPLPYEGACGIRAMLEGLTRFGWEPVREGATLIGLKKGEASVSLEPGGQLELSGAPLASLHETEAEIRAHLAEVAAIGREIGAGFLGLGAAPTWRLSEMPVMPKGRYAIMRRYMPMRGSHGLDMMFRTCTVQVNLDFASEADMVKKMRVGLALQPIATALFANSPFTEGKPNGLRSFRSRVWLDVDPDRTGMLPFVFESGMGFERYVDYALDVPMYFVYRGGRYVDVAGQPFRAFLERKLPGLEGEAATLSDWADHLTTIFPEVRLKRFIEMRGADSGPLARLCALPALWTGLLYDGPALDAAYALIADWTEAERQALRAEVPKTALATPFRSRTVRDIARDTLAIARLGLAARRRAQGAALDEAGFLDPLDAIVESGRTPADDLLDAYKGPWGGDIARVFADCAY